MKIILTRALHDADGKEIPAGTELERKDGQELIDIGGAVPAPVPPSKPNKPRSE